MCRQEGKLLIHEDYTCCCDGFKVTVAVAGILKARLRLLSGCLKLSIQKHRESPCLLGRRFASTPRQLIAPEYQPLRPDLQLAEGTQDRGSGNPGLCFGDLQ